MSRQPTDAPIAAKKSYRDGCVTVTVWLKCGGYGDSAKIDARTELTAEQARTLARALADLADQSDAKVARKAAEAARRGAWRDREIAAGRMVVLGRL